MSYRAWAQRPSLGWGTASTSKPSQENVNKEGKQETWLYNTYFGHCQSSALNKPLLFSAICFPISAPLFLTLSTFPFSGMTKTILLNTWYTYNIVISFNLQQCTVHFGSVFLLNTVYTQIHWRIEILEALTKILNILALITITYGNAQAVKLFTHDSFLRS